MATGRHEERVRVVCHLPLNNDDQEFVLFKVIELLKQLRNRDKNSEIGGFTMSRLESPVFFGYWWSDTNSAWVKDNIVVCYLDYVVNPDEEPVSAVVRLLKAKIEELYTLHAKKETEIWIVAHPIIRHE